MKKQSQTKKPKTQNAITLLESQHREVEELFEQFETASQDEDAKQAFAVASKVCELLTVHATLEEDIFYPAAQSEETGDGLAKAAVEHMSAKRLIADIQALDGQDNNKLKALMTVLQEQIEHHVEEEEEQTFPQSTEVLSAAELVELGEHMQARAEELKMATDDAEQDEDDVNHTNEDEVEVDDDVSKDQLSAKHPDMPTTAHKKAAKTSRAHS